jgi:hypothetical protein
VAIAIVTDPATGWLVARATGPLQLADVIDFVRNARADVETRRLPLLFDARGATTTMTAADADAAVATAAEAIAVDGRRGHVALVADEDRLYAWMLEYEAKCAAAGIRVIRVFRQRADAERWLGIMTSTRNFSGGL